MSTTSDQSTPDPTPETTGEFAAAAGSPSYEIECLDDFQKVPSNRIAACLSEFADYLEMVRNFKVLAESVGEMLGVDGALKGQSFVWIDDGKNERTIQVEPVGNAEPSAAA